MTRFIHRPALTAAAMVAALGLAACATTGSVAQQADTTGTATATNATAALEARVSAYENALNRGQMVAGFDFLPPRLKAAMAQDHGLSQTDMRAMMESISASAARDGKISTDLDLSKAQHGTAANGTPYALIPATARVGEGNPARHATILALHEAGTWYLIPLDGPTGASRVKSLYPEFKSVPLPTGS